MKKWLQRSIQGSLGAVTGTNTYITPWQFMDSFERCMIQIVWTGTPVANVSVLISADPINSPESYASIAAAAPVNFDIAANTTTSTSGKTILTYEITGTAANWIALQWANTSGTGTITSINFVGKGSLV
jgi:hypothetical protein